MKVYGTLLWQLHSESALKRLNMGFAELGVFGVLYEGLHVIFWVLYWGVLA